MFIWYNFCSFQLSFNFIFKNEVGIIYKQIVHKNVVGDSSMIGFPLVKADSERDIPGIQPELLTTELQKVRQYIGQKEVQVIQKCIVRIPWKSF